MGSDHQRTDRQESAGRTEPVDRTEPADRDAGRDRYRDRAVALLALVQPTFLGPAVAMAVVGGTLASTLDPRVLGLHATAVGIAVYVAHLRDAHVDRFVRGEEPARGATPAALRAALVCASLAFAVVAWALWTATGPIAAAVTFPLWLLAAIHAPYLDTTPVGVTADYAIGVVIAFLGAYALQTGGLSASVVAAAAVFLIVLSAVKIAVDGLDHGFDRSIAKRTVPVAVGPAGADRIAAGLLILAGAGTVALAAFGVLPTLSATGSIVLIVAAAAVFVRPRRRSVRLLIACVYPFTALFLGGLCVGTDAVCGTAVTAFQSWIV